MNAIKHFFAQLDLDYGLKSIIGLESRNSTLRASQPVDLNQSTTKTDNLFTQVLLQKANRNWANSQTGFHPNKYRFQNGKFCTYKMDPRSKQASSRTMRVGPFSLFSRQLTKSTSVHFFLLVPVRGRYHLYYSEKHFFCPSISFSEIYSTMVERIDSTKQPNLDREKMTRSVSFTLEEDAEIWKAWISASEDQVTNAYKNNFKPTNRLVRPFESLKIRSKIILRHCTLFASFYVRVTSMNPSGLSSPDLFMLFTAL